MDRNVIPVLVLDHRHAADRHVLLLWKTVAILFLLAIPTAASAAEQPRSLFASRASFSNPSSTDHWRVRAG
ncbi:MAG: hypothetical protein WCH20_15880 [Nitrospira sp.]